MPNRQVISLEADQQTERRPLVEILRDGPGNVTTPRTIDRDTVLYSHATGRSPEEVRDIVEAGQGGQLGQEATVSTHATIANEVDGAAETEEELNERIATMIDGMREADMLSRFFTPALAAAVRSNISGSREMAVDRLARVFMTGDAIQERMESMGGVGSTILDFAEVLVDPLDIIHQRTYVRLVEEYQDLLAPGVSIEEFEEGLERILTEAEDAGFFSDQNRFYFGSFLDTLNNGVYSGQQRANEILGWLDVGITGAAEALPLALRGTQLVRTTAALTGSTALSSTGTLIRGLPGAVLDSGRDTLSATGLLRPSANRDRIVEESLLRTLIEDDPSATSVSAPMHTQTSISTPVGVRGGFLSAPSHTAIRRFEMNAESLDMVRDWARSSGRTFDDETIQAFATEMTADRLRYLREQGSLRVIDVEVGLDDFDNIIMNDILGTTRGDYFRSAAAAQRAAGYGDEVIMIGEGQYAVYHRENISPDNLGALTELGYTGDLRGLALYRATDPDQLGSGLLARLGSPGAQGDPEMQAYLFLSNSVMQRAIHEVNTQTKALTRGMTNRQVSETYRAFDYLAESPRMEAFNRQQFIDWFESPEGLGRTPTDSQVGLYLLEQQRLNTQLFMQANEVYRNAVRMNARTFRDINGEEYVVSEVTGLPDTALVNLDGRVVRADSPDLEGITVYRNEGGNDIPGDVQYIASQTPEIRSVRHSDFLVRNAGGHRAYIVNQMQHLLKQRNTRVYADGSTSEGAPRTMMGARTEEEAVSALDDINAIQDELHRALPTGSYRTADEYAEALRTTTTPQLNRVVQANNGFYPSITTVDELVDFAIERGLDLRTRFQRVAEGDQLVDMVGPDSNLFNLPNMNQGDQVRMAVLRGGRGSLPLPAYGGGTVTTRATREVIEGSYASSIGRTTEAAFRIRAAQGTIKAAMDSGVLKLDGFREIARLPLRTQIERILRDNLIDTSADVGRRLNLDLQRLQFRLQKDSFTVRQWNAFTRTASNFLYRKNFQWASDKFDRWSSDPVSALRGLAFDAYLGMFNFSQLLMQSVQVINIVGVAGQRGLQGAAMYGPMRFALSNGHPQVIRRIGEALTEVTGLEPEQFETMVEMFRRSGRGYVDNNLAEMTPSEDAMSRFGGGVVGQRIRDFREAGRIFFKEGDLVARITGFNTAYLRYLDEVGPISGPDDMRAIRWITNEDQRLTNYMTAESRQAYEQLPFMQFMTYQLRINEAIFSGTFGGSSRRVLSNGERARLAATHFAMFGAMATTPTAFLVEYLNANTNVGSETNEHVVRLWQRGLLDTLLSYFSGSDTAASSRFSSSGGMYNIMRQLAEDNVATIAVGPSGQFAGRVLDTGIGTFMSGLRAVATGDTQYLEDDIVNLVRLTSSGNYTYNAFVAYRTGEYLSRRGSLVSDDMSQMDAMFMAFGIPLEEIDSFYSYMTQRRIQTSVLNTHAQNINELYSRAAGAVRREDWEAYSSYMRQIGLGLNSLTPWERDYVDSRIRIDSQSFTDSFLVEMMRRDVNRWESRTDGL